MSALVVRIGVSSTESNLVGFLFEIYFVDAKRNELQLPV